MLVRFTRQAYPRGGGFVYPAGAVRDLPPDLLRRLPKGSYVKVRGRKRQNTPADRQFTGGQDK